MKAKILDSHTSFFMDDQEYDQLVYNRDCLIKERDAIAKTGSSEYVEYLGIMIEKATSNIDGYLPYKPAGSKPELSIFQGLDITYQVIDKEIVQVYTIIDNDKGKLGKEIGRIKKALSDDDYKIIKCYEASLLGKSLPYDLLSLHLERQAARDRVNELEAVIGGMASTNI